jgi:NAD-dependent dihydropyrimidine dehydrogenase PreA subunit
MPYVITEACIGTKDKSCVDVCPVDCIYEGDKMLYIHPDECIDCGACVPACPVAAIYDSHDSTPASQKDLIPANDLYRSGDADAIAKAEAIVKAHVDANPELMAIDPKERQVAHG